MPPVRAKGIADVRRHRLQAVVVFVIAALAITVGSMGGTLLVQTSSPYDRAFADLAGPHLIAVFDAQKVNQSQVAATASLPGVAATAGPWTAAPVPFEKNKTKFALAVLGRDDPDGTLDREQVVLGRWIQGAGEIVVTRSFAVGNEIAVGDRLTWLATPSKPVLTVVGEVGDGDPNRTRGWVSSGVAASLVAADAPVDYEMAYRFQAAASRADIRADLNVLSASLPPGALAGSASYLDFRDGYNFNNSLILTFLLAFAVVALAAVAVIVANVVTGAVLAGYRDIGIMKAIGFSPRQVVMVFVLQILIPALAAGGPVGPLRAHSTTPLP